MVTRYNADDVRRRLDRLREEYDLIVETERERLAPDDFDEFAAIADEGYTGGGYAWVVREQPKPLSETMPGPEELDERYPRILLALGRGDDGWGPAGGGRERGETYEEAAVRKVREETGVECEILDCRRVVDRTFVREQTADEIHTLWAFFTAREAGGNVVVLESELNGAAWFGDLPPNLHWSVEDRPFHRDEWEG